MSTGLPVDAFGERLLPFEDIAALDCAGRRVVKHDFAGQMHAERDDFPAVPLHRAVLSRAGGPTICRNSSTSPSTTELVARPGEGSQPRQLPHVIDVDAGVNEAAAVPPREADRYARLGAPKNVLQSAAIDARARIGIKVRAVQRHERCDRRVDVQRRRSVERQVQLFFVLVLALEETPLAASRSNRACENEQHDFSAHASRRATKHQNQ